MTLISETSFRLLRDLGASPTKEWYDAHKADIKQHCLTPFGKMLEHVSNRLVDHDLPLEGSAKTMFRMHRDIRFSKDKTPYKSTVTGLLTPSGTKTETAGMVYVEMNASGGWAAGGFYSLPTNQLAAIRQRIAGDATTYQSILAGLSAAGVGLEDMNRLSRMPKGFTQYDAHPYADDIKRKSFIVRTEIPKPAWLNGDVTGMVADLARAVTPLIRFGRATIAA